MPSTEELKLIVETWKAPPFSQKLSVIQLHDELKTLRLYQMVHQALQHIDERNPRSPHRVDLRSEAPEDTVNRIIPFITMLKYPVPGDDYLGLQQALLAGDRDAILSILYFLLKDLETHRKRAYLAPFLSAVEVPVEFQQDDAIADLSKQLATLQDDFKAVHKLVSQHRQSGNATAVIKREIQQMEEEKQQVQAKIGRIGKKVEQVPNHEQWLEAARSLRQEQSVSADLVTRLKEQKNQLMGTEQRYAQTQQNLKEIKAINTTASPETLLQKMKDESKINGFLSDEKLPRAVEERRKEIDTLQQILGEPERTRKELEEIEDDIALLNSQLVKATEKKIMQGSTGLDDKLSMFRQQASIISRKKEIVGDKLNAAMEEVNQLTQELEKKQAMSPGTQGSKVLKGEEFKKYVSNLREKSTVYKRKKMELNELTTEYGILARTEEILKQKEASLRESITAWEKKTGMTGFSQAQETLEKVSEKKSELDEAKGKTLNEISEIVNKLVESINEKKTHLSPVIQELRTLRNTVQELETSYMGKKKIYDATMVGLEAEIGQLEQDVRTYRQDIANDQSRYHYLNAMIGISDIALEKVLSEMKAYIGGDEILEGHKKMRGFKTYREMYNRKIIEQENVGKALREQQKEIKASHERNMRQLGMFQDVRKLLQLKIESNKAVITRGGRRAENDEGTVMQDRLVL